MSRAGGRGRGTGRDVARAERRPAAPAGEPRRKPPVAPAPETPGPPGRGVLRVGDWLWACRAGFERDLGEELLHLSPRCGAALLDGPFVRSARRPARHPVFGRQCMPVDALFDAASGGGVDPVAVATTLRRALLERWKGRPEPWALHAWTPDTDAGRSWARRAQALAEAVLEALGVRDPALREALDTSPDKARPADQVLAQLCLLSPSRVVVGASRQGEVPSRFAGGFRRLVLSGGAPSRAVLKLDEALEWLGLAPEPGDVCVDLGAAPGGWTFGVLERGARVVAVDLGHLSKRLVGRKGLHIVHGNAFHYEPPETVDWLLCDMTWRPLEVAALLARWGRRRDARFLVANIKLPMRRKVEMVYRVLATLTEAGWQNVRARQLYHDREELTLVAHL